MPRLELSITTHHQVRNTRADSLARDNDLLTSGVRDDHVSANPCFDANRRCAGFVFRTCVRFNWLLCQGHAFGRRAQRDAPSAHHFLSSAARKDERHAIFRVRADASSDDERRRLPASHGPARLLAVTEIES